MIFQLIDDHSRHAVASHVAWGETSAAAIIVFDKAVTAHGVPERLLSDNGDVLNPSRRGVLAENITVKKLASNGVFTLAGVFCMVSARHGFQHVLVITDGDHNTVTDHVGQIPIEHTRPEPGITYVGNGNPRGIPPTTTTRTTPKS